MSEAIKIRCPRCKTALRVSHESLENSIRCQHCAQTFRAVRKPKMPLPEIASVAGKPIIDSAPDSEPASQSTFESIGELNAIPISVRSLQSRTAPSAKLAIVTVIALVAAAAAAFGLYRFGWLSGGNSVDSRRLNGADSVKLDEPKSILPPATKPASASHVHFPRRFLFVGVHQYAYANPISPTPTTLLMPAVLREFAEKKLRIDKDQVTILSDLASEKEARPPRKPIIEQTIEHFLATSRPQDRIVLVFVGHALDLDELPYLAPIEGELSNKETLIPLQWLYDRLAACPARQKVLIIDTCRMDSARGEERPGSGPMGPRLDAALANPPPGVQVWSSCIANQFSHEFEQANVKNVVVRGSAFLSLLTQAFAQGGNVQKPEEPLPLDFLVKQVNGPVQDIVKLRDSGAVQTPRLAGHEVDSGLAYDPSVRMPPHIELPKSTAFAQGGVADPKEIEKLIREVAVPPLKLPRDKGQESPEQQAAALAATFPFSAETMKPYAADYHSLREILDKPKDYPLRVAILKTAEALDRQGRLNRIRIGDKEVSADSLIEKFRDSGSDAAVKKSLTRSQQDGPALMLVELQELLELMEKVGRNRDREPSKRWQAHYDYVLARLKMRMVYVNEYNVMIAKVKRDELPKLEPKLHNGWRLAAQEKITSPKEVKDLASDARKLMTKLMQEHPGTPWEVLAKRERSTALGLVWQPTNLSQD
jgi:predicted Zn finger-like uncharacterized protein